MNTNLEDILRVVKILKITNNQGKTIKNVVIISTPGISTGILLNCCKDETEQTFRANYGIAPGIEPPSSSACEE